MLIVYLIRLKYFWILVVYIKLIMFFSLKELLLLIFLCFFFTLFIWLFILLIEGIFCYFNYVLFRLIRCSEKVDKDRGSKLRNVICINEYYK